MNELDFGPAFEALTGNPPFPWQRALYADWFSQGKFPASCNLPTGLGKTSVIAVWLIALANGHAVPRRLVYVVNRRTVVDQTTTEVEKYRNNSTALNLPEPLAISTLRGQFADNREWSADPSRPAVICGTVDMIGSRLLFSGYGCGFKTRPLHAGFLGQDALVVHDEAHLEPAFQKLLLAIEKEQREGRTPDFRPLKVMELTATSRAGGEAFGLSDEDGKDATVQKRINAKKAIHLHENKDEKKLADEIADFALKYKDSGRAILVFVRKVDDVEKIVAKLKKEKQKHVQQLTGTLRGLERDDLVKDPIFVRFLPKAVSDEKTVYLVCTSAGEVGVNISADHLVCDLSTFESMAQRFGRVNRFGERDDTEVHVVYPKEFDKDKPPEPQMRATLELLRKLPKHADGSHDGSPAALGKLDPKARQDAFAPTPTILPVSDILFDAWALTTNNKPLVKDKLPGRPPVEPYLHGIVGWELPETHVAWREEVWELRLQFTSDEDRKSQEPAERKRLAKLAEDLLEDYPLKPHELLRDRSDRVFKHLTTIATRHPAAYVWLVDDEGTVEVFTLKELADKDEKDRIDRRTVLLPPEAGGLRDGLLDGSAAVIAGLDVADALRDEQGDRRRMRVWNDESKNETKDMRPIRHIEFPAGEDEDAGDVWHWFEQPRGGDSDGSKANKLPVLWQTHTDDVVKNTKDIVAKLSLGELADALVIAAECHDLGKRRKLFQTVLGNRGYPKVELAKSGKKSGRIAEKYRHEFGSLIDADTHEGFKTLKDADLKAFVLHVIATHHGRGRPHFPQDEVFDPERSDDAAKKVAREVPQRFARLQRKYGRWGLAYLESLLRAADYAASRQAIRIRGGREMSFRVNVDPTNPGQFFACCGLLELADRLWPGAEGWFREREFHIAAPGTPTELFGTLAECHMTNTMTAAQHARFQAITAMKVKERKSTPGVEAEEKTLGALLREAPIVLKSPFDMTLDWFADDYAGGSRFKTWAGRQSVLDISTAMKGALAPTEWRNEQCLSFTVTKCGLPFNFDSDLGAQGGAIDIGFSFDPLAGSALTRIESSARPALELLAFIGLQRFRPTEIKGENRFLYTTWNQPLPVQVAMPAACGAMPVFGANRYEFRLLYRTKYLKSFLPAIPFVGGSDE